MSLENFPSCVLEITDHEVQEWYSPKDFAIGKTVTLLGRTFFIYDCDKFTQDFYRDKYGITDFQPVDVNKKPLEKVPQVLQFLKRREERKQLMSDLIVKQRFSLVRTCKKQVQLKEKKST